MSVELIELLKLIELTAPMGPILGHGVDRADAAEEPERETELMIRQCYGALQLQSVFTELWSCRAP